MKRDFRGVIYFNAFILTVLIVVSFFNLMFFHTVIELSTIFIGIAIYIIAVYSREYTNSHLLIFIGVSYIFIGSMDLLHALTYDELGIFNFSKNSSVEFWLSARLTEAFVLFLAYRYVMKLNKLGLKKVYIIFIIITSSMLAISVFADFMPLQSYNGIYTI